MKDQQIAAKPDMTLFWGSFIALIATSFGFIARVLTAGDWGREFGLSETQVGEILGVGLWPFAISIILFGLIIDRIGYKVAMWIGLVCHLLSTVFILMAKDYTLMYVGTFILALGSGTVEAYINPVVATMFSKDKTKWLNALHAGWPGGMVIGGLIILFFMPALAWKVKIGLILIPTLVYAIMLWNKKFPINERVAANIPYKDMLKEVGAIGAVIISFMVFAEIGRLLGLGSWFAWTGALVCGALFYNYTKSFGRPLYIILLLIMMILATTELGVDSWISDLMNAEMQNMGLNGGWVLIYTSLIMMVLRFFAGPLVHKLSPLGLLATCAVLAAIGLALLSNAAGAMILIAATLYGIGKTFFWPTTLGIVSEQFPRGGALTLNAIAGMGMLAVGTFGNPILGNIQDRFVTTGLQAHDSSNGTSLYNTYVLDEKRSVLGKYMSVNQEKLASAPDTDKVIITSLQNAGKKETLWKIALFPVIMALSYLGLILYFRSRGGYKAISLSDH